VGFKLILLSVMEETRTLRNNYYLGHYGKVIDEVKGFSSESPAELAFYYRALLETNPALVFKNITDRSPTALQAIKLLGTYRTAMEDNKELVFETLNEWLSDEILGNDPTLNLIASQIYFEEKNFKDALRLVINGGENLEMHGMCVQIYLKMDRVDLAAKACAVMADIDDDDVLTQLCTAWLNITQGGSKITEASFLLQELVDKFGPSIPVLVSAAVCQMHLANFADSNNYLKQARALALETNSKVSPDTLINYIVALNLNKRAPEIINKITGELSDSYPNHPWLQTQKEMESLFDTHAAKYI